jgi:glycosyltransferase involved in cell wall biosynthesis
MKDKKKTNENGLPEKRVVLFTSNYHGGIFQFTMQLASVFKMMNFKTIVAIPDQSQFVPEDNDQIEVIWYQRFKSLRPNNQEAKKIAEDIESQNPDLVIFCDDGIVSTQVLLVLKRQLKTILYIHDVKPHLTRFTMYNYLKQILRNKLQRKALGYADEIILLSENSYQLFKQLQPAFLNKALWMPIGAHIPKVEEKIPLEWKDGHIQQDYYLFFGRIDKYKGIINLLKAYDSISESQVPYLVIAGSGDLLPEENEYILKNDKIKLINRFIEDGEMLYLMKHSRTVVLPYLEASQSGVIPIAYYFGVPVIISNVPGLTEFVEDGKTGIICADIQEIENALLKMNNDHFREKMSQGAMDFHQKKLDWERNLKRCIGKIIN